MQDMKIPVRGVFAVFAALLLSFGVTACHSTGKKQVRPPATGNTTGTSSGDYGTGARTTNSGNEGRDIQGIGDPYGSSTNIPDDPTGEGGPLADIRFEYDSAALTPAAQQTLSAHAAWLKDRRQPVTLEGHCDERGTVEYNLALGEQRAKAVYD